MSGSPETPEQTHSAEGKEHYLRANIPTTAASRFLPALDLALVRGFAPFCPCDILASPKPGTDLMLSSCQSSLWPQTFLNVTQAELVVCSSRTEALSHPS